MWIGKLKCVGNSVLFVCVTSALWLFLNKPLANISKIFLAATSALEYINITLHDLQDVVILILRYGFDTCL